jgi:hypothetical protein
MEEAMLRLASLTSVLALFGCANQGDEGMIVLNNTAIAGACTLSGTKGQPFIAHGQIYAYGSAGYFLTPLIESRVVLAEGDTDLTQRTIFLKGANITLEVKAVSIEKPGNVFSTGSITLSGTDAQFSSLFSGSLPPSGTVNVGFDVIPVPTLRKIAASSGAADGDRWTAEVLATVSILGELGGDDVESLPFQFPIAVCNDCVVRNLGACPKTPVNTGNACNIFQDGAVDCCVDAAGFLVCPADPTPL